MSKTKLEFIYVELVEDDPSNFRMLGDWAVDGPMPMVVIPNVGEHVRFDLVNKHFAGEITGKVIEFSQKDIAGQEWDLVTRVILTVQLYEKPELHIVGGKEAMVR